MPRITFIYANRNRDIKRITRSLDSLANLKSADIEVILVDYGSYPELVEQLQEKITDYRFVKFYPLKVQKLLWNKSKALNYGIIKSDSTQIFIADVDLIFHPETFLQLDELVNEKEFHLFSLNYLSEFESKKLYEGIEIPKLQPERSGNVNGMILAPKKAFLEINGFDEFFHFYGGEDVDLFARMENAGYTRNSNTDLKLFYHNWHKSFSGSEDKLITRNPRVKNIMRINQQHYLSNKRLKRVCPEGQLALGNIIDPKEAGKLNNPDHIYEILNIQAQVEHFLNEELKSLSGVVLAKFQLDSSYRSIKHRIKELAGKETQPYISLKEVNDLILKKIVFEYRNANYSFEIAEDLKSIEFIIELNPKEDINKNN